MKTEFDLELIQKYNRSGPRYTSYPTALQFSDSVDKASIYEDLRKADGPLSLYFHIPFCQKLCWFCACNTIITTKQGSADAYLDLLDKEAAQWIQLTSRKRPVSQVHLGGGSPSFLSPEQIYKLGSILHSYFSVIQDAECGIELDPRSSTEAKAAALRDVGFNRVSIGIQESNPKVQKAINRIQPQELNQETVSYLRRLGFTSINVDLVYGLPYQTQESIRQTIADVIALNPDRIATFNYAHVPWMKPAQKLLERTNALPEATEKLEMFRILIEEFTAAGYVFIGMDHFAKPNDPLSIALKNKTLRRNFQGYSTGAGTDILAMGISSISQSENAYFQNFKGMPEYRNALESGQVPLAKGYVLTEEDQRRREIIMRLMCDFELNYEQISKRIGVDVSSAYATELESLQRMQADGLLEMDSKGLWVTGKGRLLIRNIAMHFDAYLKFSEQRHSKTI